MCDIYIGSGKLRYVDGPFLSVGFHISLRFHLTASRRYLSFVAATRGGSVALGMQSCFLCSLLHCLTKKLALTTRGSGPALLVQRCACGVCSPVALHPSPFAPFGVEFVCSPGPAATSRVSPRVSWMLRHTKRRLVSGDNVGIALTRIT